MTNTAWLGERAHNLAADIVQDEMNLAEIAAYIAAALREARREALEEAAKRLDQEAEDWCEEIAGTFKEAARICLSRR